ncbi:urease accessory protein UreD [Spirulina subsalsa FACHB-351]|uniref:Urease accessory protein UreD n=1 Tax=Spirulina subsalsa FACHB-351 TaxID=234711 RepID=A0ABT3L8P0_9CYAN|nr:urease accessory protein UreD [Spirulina subsalsa]MCW6037864.1 urease accessory protein UreD [Spirulina subsalsa FACHB-351]
MRSPWQGKLHLIYHFQGGATQIKYQHNQAPLKVQRPFYPEGPQICHTVALHTAGGIVGGDQLTQRVELQPDSQVLITTAAAQKIYGSQGETAKNRLDLELGRGAYLEWLPQESIVFEGAEYRQELRVNLDPEATFCTWEITRFGRTARGERFLRGNWRSHTEIWQGGKPLWIDRQWLPGSLETVESPHALAGCPIVASFLWLGTPIDPEHLAALRDLWSPSPHSWVGLTQTQNQGLYCRYRGRSTQEVKGGFMRLWHYLRGLSGGSGNSMPSRPLIPRVWGNR